MHTSASTPRELCYSIKSVCDYSSLAPVARPWNRFDPENTSWWLVPSSEWPAYQFGKLYFDWRGLDHTAMTCGIYIEKGLDPAVAAAYPSKKGARYILRHDWIWSMFLHDLESGAVSTAAEKALLGADELELRIEGGYVPDPGSFDPYAPEFRESKAKYFFSCTGTPPTCKLTSSKDAHRLMIPIGEITDFNSLSKAFRALMTNQWLWIDFFLGVPVTPIAESSERRTSTEDELWSKHLQVFARWLRDGT